MKALDRKTRAVLRKFGAHEAAASVERLYLHRNEHGRGLSNLLHEWEGAMVSKMVYWHQSSDPMIQGVLRYHKAAHLRNEKSEYREVVEILWRYGLRMEDVVEVRTGSQKLKRGQVLALKQRLTAKVVHGAYYKTVVNRPADKRLSALWLTRGVLQSKTEAFIVGMQDGVTKVLAYRRRILKQDVNPVCRICGNGDETLGHVLTICENSLYHLISDRHDAVVRVLATAVMVKLDLPKVARAAKVKGMVVEGRGVKVVVDRRIVTSETLYYCKPDLVVTEARKITILEVAVAWDPSAEGT